jgi:hypothetical protein
LIQCIGSLNEIPSSQAARRIVGRKRVGDAKGGLLVATPLGSAVGLTELRSDRLRRVGLNADS